MDKVSKVVIILCATLLTLNVSAQRFMIGYGIAVYTDIAFLNSDFTDDEGSEINSTGFSLATLSVEMKYNLHEFNSDLALSAASSPALGLMTFSNSNSDNLGHYRVPIMAQLDWGNLSTFESLKDFGVGLGIGYQFAAYNLFGEGNSLSANGMVARLGFRYFNRKNAAREIAIKYEFPREVEQEYEVFDFNNPSPVTQTVQYDLSSVSLSFILYFNY